MTTLGRGGWWAVLATGATALLLSLVVLVRAATSPGGTGAGEEVRGSAAVGTSRTSSSDPGQREDAVRRDPPRVTAAPAVPPVPEPVVAPVRVRVPTVGLDMAVRPTGVGRGGQMQLPSDPRLLGWYRFGPAPSSGTGAAVLAGHVDSRRYGVGPLSRLAAVSAGDTVRVLSADGRVTVYRVDSIERFDRQGLPDAVFTRSGPERLRLVTCTGAFIPEAGGYQQNLVVTAVPARAG